MFVNIVMEEEASRYLACLFVCIVYSRGYLVIGRGRRALGRPQGYALSSAASFAFLRGAKATFEFARQLVNFVDLIILVRVGIFAVRPWRYVSFGSGGQEDCFVLCEWRHCTQLQLMLLRRSKIHQALLLLLLLQLLLLQLLLIQLLLLSLLLLVRLLLLLLLLELLQLVHLLLVVVVLLLHLLLLLVLIERLLRADGRHWNWRSIIDWKTGCLGRVATSMAQRYIAERLMGVT